MSRSLDLITVDSVIYCNVFVGNKEAKLTDCSFKLLLKGSYDAILKIIILCIWCNRICWHAFNVKKTHYFSKTVHYCRFSMTRLSQTTSFSTKSLLPTSTVCSDWPTDTVHCDWLNTTRLVGNVTPLTIIASFSFQNESENG